MAVTELLIEFLFFSFLGWVWETVYCTIKTGHWSNRGFLYGPVCPIYGAGCLLAQYVFGRLWAILAFQPSIWQIFVICTIGSAALEYATSYVLEKKYHARWWDYSSIPLNLNGRISLPTTLGFGLAGVLVVKVLLPGFLGVGAWIPMQLMDLLSLVFAWIFGADFALTQASLSPLIEKIEQLQAGFDEKAESIVTGTIEERERLKKELEGQIEARIKEQVKNLSARQRYILSNIQRFHNAHKTERAHGGLIGERLREAIKERKQ